jgi:hypothetical protein
MNRRLLAFTEREADMEYVAFIIADDGLPAPEALAVMQRELPGWIEEMDGRGVRLFGRELDLPETATTVRVRDGEALVTDGPFAETKEFIAGFDVLQCANLNEATEVMAKSPVCWFHPIEIRPLSDGLELSEQASAFGRSEDGAGRPYLLNIWVGETPAARFDQQVLADEIDAWRRDVKARGLHILGAPLGAADTARTMRVRGGATLVSDGPGIKVDDLLAEIEVISCAERQQAIELAIAHPISRYHAIEVRPFYIEEPSEAAQHR